MEAAQDNTDINTDDAMMDDAPMQMADGNSGNSDDDSDIDDTPLFVGEGDAVEVQVDDTDIPMDDDDLEDGQQQQQQQPEEPIVDMARFVISSHTDPVYAVACTFHENLLRIVSGGGDDKAFWHEIPLADSKTSTLQIQSTSLEPRYQFKDSVSAVAGNAPFIGFDATQPPNPEWMAVGGLDGSVVLFGPGNNGKVQPLEGPTSDIEWLCWHPKGGNVLLVGSSDATIWMYHTGMNKCLQVFVGHEDAVTCGAFSANGKVALSGSADGTLRIWAPKTGKSKHVFRFASHNANGGGGPPPALTCMATHGGTDEHLVMAGAEDGQAHICHVANKKHVASLRHFDPSLHSSVDSNNNTHNQDDEEEDVVVPSGVEAVGFSKSNPNWCATGGMDGVLKIWDLANQGQCRHSCRVNQSAAAAAAQQQQLLQPPQSILTGDGITQLKWHPTMPLVVTSTCRGQVHLWDARNGQLLQTLTGHSDVINDMDVSFVPSSTGGAGGHAVVVTASDDKTVRIFDLDIDAVLLHASQQPQQQ